MADRIRRLTERCGLAGSDGILVHRPSNVFYLSGFTGEGQLVVSGKRRAIVTDFRYVEQAQAQAPGYEVHSVTNDVNHAQLAAKLLKETGAETVLYEDDFVTVREADRLASALGGIGMGSLGNAPESLREIKDDAEIALLRKAFEISDEAFGYIVGVIREGLSETQVKRMLEFRMLELGAQEAAFATIVASGPNGSLPHAIAGERTLKKGDLVTLDFGAKYGGYCADMTRTVAVGRPDSRMLEIFDLVLETQKACQDALAPGKACSQVDGIARKMIGDAGYGDKFGHGLGHAVGIDVHENPRLNPRSPDTLQPGHVVTVEPGVYLPGLGGVRIENTCLITPAGAESLVDSPRELQIL